MKRQKRQMKRGKNRNAGSSAKNKAPKTKLTRRDFLQKIGYGTLGATIVGSGSWFFVEEVRATVRESDLSQIG
ncbi:MAG: twin-arginine translocation signal domain-containing protein, partial [Sneathiella sp.]|uniref:twin-arginine translocation signal domain-containing protein n=1 Tax=Sneathiella sp. TaxID=1964365 RepID=UPI0030011173